MDGEENIPCARKPASTWRKLTTFSKALTLILPVSVFSLM